MQSIETKRISTTFDGTNKDGYTQYMMLNGENGLKAPIGNAKALNTNLDYTIMLWLKPTQNVWSRDLSYAFSIPKSFSCSFTSSANLICESSEVCEKLNVSTKAVAINEWVHLTVAGSQKPSESYVALETHTERLGLDERKYVIL